MPRGGRPRRARLGSWLGGRLAGALALGVIAACAGLSDFTGPTPRESRVARVELSSAEVSIGVGSTVTLLLTARDLEGRVISDRAVRWSSSDSTVVRVSETGVLTALAEGRAQVAASVGGQSATAQVTVVARPVASISVLPITLDLQAGEVAQLQATTRDELGLPLANRPVLWESSTPEVAVVDATGFVSGLAPGVASISATSEGRVATVGVVVSAVPVRTLDVAPALDSLVVGQSSQLTAVPRAANGVPLADRLVTWTSAAPNVATVSASGLVFGVAPGRATITAESEDVMQTATVVVQPRPIGAVIVSPAQATLRVGDTLTLLVQVTDDEGALLPGRPVTFSSSTNAVASVSATGTIRAASPGIAEITVRSEGRASTVSITVLPTAVVSARLEPATLTLGVGDSAVLRAVPLDANGRPLPDRPAVFTSGAPTVLSVSASGVVRALAAGTGVVFASIDGRVASAQITITAPAVAAVQVTPPVASLIINSTLDLTATARDARGVVLAGPTVSWSSSNPVVAVVSSTGRVRALALGTVRIDATLQGVTGSSVMTVVAVPVASVDVQLGATALSVGATTSATAVPRDATGAPLIGRAVTWSSSNPAVATVSSIGQVQAVSVGTASIVATVEGVNGAATLTVSPIPVATVEVSAPDSSLVPFDTVQVTAITRAASGAVLTGRQVTWLSSDTTVATVNASGRVIAHAVGQSTITATSEGQSGTILFTVSPAPVATVTVALGRSNIVVADTTQATAVLRDARGIVLSGRPITWSSSDQSVATVNALGVVTAVAPGSATITATSEGVSGSAVQSVGLAPVATVTLSAPDSSLIVFDTVQVTAELRDAGGNVLTGRTITWSSSNVAVAAVNSTGEVAAAGVGSATITATSEGQSATIVFTVAPAPVASVVAELSDSSLVVGATTQGIATLRDARNNVLTGRVVTWASSDEAIATVSGAGLVTAVAAGSATITATSEGVSDDVALTVTVPPPAPVDTVLLSAPDSSLIVFDTVQVTAELRDADGNVLTGRTITWSSSDTDVLTVSNTGEVAAAGVGSATVTATSEGKSAAILFTIAPAPVASVLAELGDSSLVVGATTQGTTTLRDARNNVLTGRVVTWASSDEAIATVSGAGLVTAVAAGSATITATSEGVSDDVALTVTVPPPAPVDTVLLSAPDSSLIVFDTVQVTAELRDADGNVLTGRTITWSSSDTAVLTVSASGEVAAVNVGVATIAATSEGKSASIAFTVVLPPVVVGEVRLSVPDSTLVPFDTVQVAALLFDPNGILLPSLPTVWSSSDSTVATVDSTGVVIALREGTVRIFAEYLGTVGELPLVIVPAPVASVTVLLAASTIPVDGTTQATAILQDSRGHVLTGRDVDWHAVPAAIARANATGLVTGLRVGTARVIATSEGVSGEAPITVVTP